MCVINVCWRKQQSRLKSESGGSLNIYSTRGDERRKEEQERMEKREKISRWKLTSRGFFGNDGKKEEEETVKEKEKVLFTCKSFSSFEKCQEKFLSKRKFGKNLKEFFFKKKVKIIGKIAKKILTKKYIYDFNYWDLNPQIFENSFTVTFMYLDLSCSLHYLKHTRSQVKKNVIH